MKKVISTLVVAMSLLLVTNVSMAQCGGDDDDKKHTKSSCNDETSKIAAIKFHADYCGSCKKLEPKITELKSTFKDQGVVFVKFDLTDDASKSKTKTLASAEGLENVLNSNKGTGYIVLYDLKTKKVVGTLKNSQDVAEMEKTIKTYL